jgi:hypothetical protein
MEKAMEDEFDRIMEFFNLSSEEKEGRLQEVFEDSVEYFEDFLNYIDYWKEEVPKFNTSLL